MTTTPTDEDLVARTLAGDADAFGALVERHKSWVYGLALAHARDFDQADDLAQEAFVEAYVHLASLREAARFAGWLRRIVVNRCKMWARRRRSERRRLSDRTPAEADPAAWRAEHDARDLRAAVLDAIARLPAGQRQAVTLFYLDGLSTREVAGVLGVSDVTVRTRLHHARRQLKRGLMEMVKRTLHEAKPGDEFSAAVRSKVAALKRVLAAKGRAREKTAAAEELAQIYAQAIPRLVAEARKADEATLDVLHYAVERMGAPAIDALLPLALEDDGAGAPRIFRLLCHRRRFAYEVLHAIWSGRRPRGDKVRLLASWLDYYDNEDREVRLRLEFERDLALALLARLGAAGLKVLLERAKCAPRPQRVESGLARALAMAGERAEREMLRWLVSDDPRLRGIALAVMRGMRAPWLAAHAERALRDEDPQVRRLATRAFAALAPDVGDHWLAPLLNDTDERVAAEAAHVIGDYIAARPRGYSHAGRPSQRLLAEGALGERSTVADACVNALWRIGGRFATDAVIAALDSRSNRAQAQARSKLRMFTCWFLRDCERDPRTLTDEERYHMDWFLWAHGGWAHRIPGATSPQRRYRHPLLFAHALGLCGLPSAGTFTEAELTHALNAHPLLTDSNTTRRLMVDDTRLLTRDKAGEVYEMTERGRALRELAGAVGLRDWR